MTTKENFRLDWVVDVTNLPRSGTSSLFDADTHERAELAQFLQIVSLSKLNVNVKTESRKKRGVSVTGQLRAIVTQSCVVTLLPIESRIGVKIDRLLVPGDKTREPSTKDADQREVVFDHNEDDPPDTFDGRLVDIGQIALEELALNLEAYPRHPSADDWESNKNSGSGSNPAQIIETANPFAALRKLKPDHNTGD